MPTRPDLLDHFPGVDQRCPVPMASISKVEADDTDRFLWFVAVVTAIASFASYAGRNKGQRSWYVWLNLILNGAGLLFTTVVVILLFIGLFGALMKM